MILNKKITIDLFTLLVWISLSYFGLSTYFMMKHSSQLTCSSTDGNGMQTKSVVPCKEGYQWRDCPPCIQTNPAACEELKHLQCPPCQTTIVGEAIVCPDTKVEV